MTPIDRSTIETSDDPRALKDRVHLTALLLPFVGLDLGLKAFALAGTDGSGGLSAVRLLLPDVAFDCAYVAVAALVLRAARTAFARTATLCLLHVSTMFLALVSVGAYRYLRVTGTPLEADYLLLLASAPEGIGGAIASEAPLSVLLIALITIEYAVLGPAMISQWVVKRRHGKHMELRATPLRSGRLRAAGILIVLLGAPFLRGGPVSVSRLAPWGMFGTASARELWADAGEAASAPISKRSSGIVPLPDSTRRNLVIVLLESTRSAATTPYNAALATTPFLQQLANESLLVEHAYAIVPHTHNALTAVNCGTEPPLNRWGTILLSRPGRAPSGCLAHLLAQQGYKTVYFKSTSSRFENGKGIVSNLGYQEYYANESMDRNGFELTNYFGYEDEIMLEPTRRWLEANGPQPFLASYLTSAPHHDYLAPGTRHGRVKFSEDEQFDRYLNSIRNQDRFLESLFEVYKAAGRYEDTVFIIIGDHGEGFGEHGRYQHDNVIYEEGLRVPVVIHDPKRRLAVRVPGPMTQTDVLPTALDLLGFRLTGEGYSGHSILDGPDPDRRLMFSCWNEKGCLASVRGNQKFVHHFDRQPDEVFDLAVDPLERVNLAPEISVPELSRMRADVLRWRSAVHERYGTRVAH